MFSQGRWGLRREGACEHSPHRGQGLGAHLPRSPLAVGTYPTISLLQDRVHRGGQKSPRGQGRGLSAPFPHTSSPPVAVSACPPSLSHPLLTLNAAEPSSTTADTDQSLHGSSTHTTFIPSRSKLLFPGEKRGERRVPLATPSPRWLMDQ